MTLEFNYKEIRWVCTCGLERRYVKTAISSLCDLVAIWECTRCKKNVLARFPLEKLIADIPEHPVQSTSEITEEDRRIAKLMHISLEGGDLNLPAQG